MTEKELMEEIKKRDGFLRKDMTKDIKKVALKLVKSGQVIKTTTNNSNNSVVYILSE